MLRIDLNEDAGRAAYLAAMHAAQALMFETTGEASRSHGGVQRQFAQLVKDDPRVDRELRTFLPNAYNLKAIADYQIGPGSRVSAETARETVATARHGLSNAWRASFRRTGQQPAFDFQRAEHRRGSITHPLKTLCQTSKPPWTGGKSKNEERSKLPF